MFEHVTELKNRVGVTCIQKQGLPQRIIHVHIFVFAIHLHTFSLG